MNHKSQENNLKTRCGFVALVGRPNVGKSTLLNALIKQKLSITSRKPQTTRHRILGIDTQKNTQIIYVDTPGLHTQQSKAINRLMNRAAASSIEEVDLVVFIVEPNRWTEDDELVFQHICKQQCPVILFINKVDRLENKQTLLPQLEKLSKRHDFLQIIPGSALKDQQVETLKNILIQLMPQGEFIFPEDYYTDRSERFLAAEIIREKLIRQLGDELPYAITVEIESFKVDEKQLLTIHGLILVERKAQKSIVIGKAGQRLKQVGSDAREDMQKLFSHKIFLKLWVKVKDGWADDERALRSLGYGEQD